MSCNILVAFYSRGGTVEALAQAIGEGARAAGAVVRLRRAREQVGPAVMALAPGWGETAARMNAAYEAPSLEDAAWADGILLGAPTRFGAPASELLAYLEGLGALWVKNSLVGKAGAAFASSSTLHGGAETTILALYPPMAHLGLVIVPNGYGAPRSRDAGTPYGSFAAPGPGGGPTEADLEVARAQGERVARIAAALATLRRA